ncbi:Aste57867_10036 [Aphanomyces stellatus]|uniref:Aste57867_10036 protein n=1 Tax=Aphanomyces stellatus TaxID=120398 RepID=A0A485KQ17_9STRA|nr:hypothetical protein As57867_009997 [Aphanomyces stellatus]VFT86913.1 Aste57867_10036 [Aphanomyces stellatus]
MSGWEDSTSVLGSRLDGDSAARKRDRDLDMTGEDAPLEEEKKEGEEKPKKKKVNNFSDQHLLGSNGLPYVYARFPAIFNRAVTHGNEAEALRDLITGYKEWAYDLFPKLNFEDFITSTENVARRAVVANLMSDLRQLERKRGEPEEEEPAPPTSNEQWEAMKDYEASLAAERVERALREEQAAMEGEAEFESGRVVAQTRPSRREAESDGEAEFDFTGVQAAPRPATGAAAADDDDDGSEAEFKLPPLKPRVENEDAATKEDDVEDPVEAEVPRVDADEGDEVEAPVEPEETNAEATQPIQNMDDVLPEERIESDEV